MSCYAAGRYDMAKVSKNKNSEADMSSLAQAQQNYQDLVTTDTSKMSQQQKLEHHKKCRAALVEKRQAAEESKKG